jgi:hypothetical protein
VIFVESKALKQAHSKLCNCFSNAAIGKNQPLENRKGDRAKYIMSGFVANKLSGLCDPEMT